MLLIAFFNLIFTKYVVIEQNEFITQTFNDNTPIDSNSRFEAVNHKIKEPYASMKDENTIFIITREYCGWSRKMREFLVENKAKFKEVEVSNDEKAKVLSDIGLEGGTFPVVFFQGKYIGGFTDSTKLKDFVDFVKKKPANK